MAEESASLRSIYDDAEQKRNAITNAFHSNAAALQDNLLSAIQLYEQSLNIADRISLFSPNESLEDIASADLQYLRLNFHLAELLMRIGGSNRKATLQQAQKYYERYLKLLDSYDILQKSDVQLLEHFQESPSTFSTASSSDPAARRDTKIRRFKEEQSMRQRLEYFRRNPSVVQNDDDVLRDLQLTETTYCTHQTFQSLESIAQELHILSLAPPKPPPRLQEGEFDPRERTAQDPRAFSERLDSAPHLSAGMSGPLLDSKGKPLRPFTLFGSKREELRNGVFRPDHSLPTMTIDEYLDEERKRGGIIDGGGPQSEIRPEVDEDDMEAADRATMKAREWDEYVEENPRGSGNTINRG